jgi:hypothetical protein
MTCAEVIGQKSNRERPLRVAAQTRQWRNPRVRRHPRRGIGATAKPDVGADAIAVKLKAEGTFHIQTGLQN